jgi:hypothetical protein
MVRAHCRPMKAQRRLPFRRLLRSFRTVVHQSILLLLPRRLAVGRVAVAPELLVVLAAPELLVVLAAPELLVVPVAPELLVVPVVLALPVVQVVLAVRRPR